MSSADILQCHKGEAPRIVIFMEEGIMNQSCIVADENVRVEVPEPTVTKTLVALLSTYYAWHREFPKAHTAALDFFAHKIFKVTLKNNNVATFIRKIDAWKSNSSCSSHAM